MVELILNSLFPFSLVTRRDGKIVKAGRSFTLLAQGVQPLGRRIEDFFENSQQFCCDPVDQGKLRQRDARIRGLNLNLRYLPIPLNQEEILLCISPVFTDPQRVTELGITFADFSELDPVIDFMMIWQTMKITESDLQMRNLALNEINKNLRVLSAVSNLAAQSNSRETLLEKYLFTLRAEMDWQQALVVACSEGRGRPVFLKTNMELGEHFLAQEGLANRLGYWANLAAKPFVSPWRRASSGVVEYISRIPSKRGIKYDEILVLRGEEGKAYLGPRADEFYREANIFVGQALDQIEWQHLDEQNKVRLIAHSKMATLGEMAGGIAHEINNPLAVIVGHISIMEEELECSQPDLNKLTKDLDTVKKTVERITKIIKGLRAFSRNADMDPFEILPVEKVVNDTLELVRQKLQISGVDVKVDVDPELMVKCRSVQFSQVLMNLLSNAHDAVAECEQKWIKIEAKKADQSILISVINSGPEIPLSIIDKIMQPFFSTKGPRGGTGLGLSISKGIIESHAGQLDYSPIDGHTRFLISLSSI